MIAIVNYGCGNVSAFATLYRKLNIPARIATTGAELRGADKVILPGVGAFDWAMERLNRSGMRNSLEEIVLGDKRPVLGVCVGMQMLARRSEEGKLEGLDWLGGEVKRFDTSRFTCITHLPHMGWNDVQPRVVNTLFKELEGARFYFLHSYYFSPDRSEDVVAFTHYNEPFASGVGSQNIYGVQFHPEKSHQWGVKLLRNFAEL